MQGSGHCESIRHACNLHNVSAPLLNLNLSITVRAHNRTNIHIVYIFALSGFVTSETTSIKPKK